AIRHHNHTMDALGYLPGGAALTGPTGGGPGWIAGRPDKAKPPSGITTTLWMLWATCPVALRLPGLRGAVQAG
ncbi:hypothetical protein, partial [Superficieibacter electus]|uniref:hypothetical protein n=1 Tax=Superficieibacter electus TaxID=2022662 RepID=UPI001C405CE0